MNRPRPVADGGWRNRPCKDAPRLPPPIFFPETCILQRTACDTPSACARLHTLRWRRAAKWNVVAPTTHGRRLYCSMKQSCTAPAPSDRQEQVVLYLHNSHQTHPDYRIPAALDRVTIVGYFANKPIIARSTGCNDDQRGGRSRQDTTRNGAQITLSEISPRGWHTPGNIQRSTRFQ